MTKKSAVDFNVLWKTCVYFPPTHSIHIFVVACTTRSVNKLTVYIAFAAKSEEAEATS